MKFVPYALQRVHFGLDMKEWSNGFLMKNSNAFLQGSLRVLGPLNVLGDVGTNRGVNDYRLDVMQQVAGDLGQDISFDGESDSQFNSVYYVCILSVSCQID